MSVLVAHKRILTVLNILIVGTLIFFHHIGFFCDIEWFGFLLMVVSVAVVAVYRPLIVFVLFVGTIPLEIINVAPDVFEVVVRPYQLLGIALLCAVVIRRIFSVSKQKLFSWGIFDILIVIFVSLGFIGLFLASDASISFKQSIVLLSFALLYFVVRIFVKSKENVGELLEIIISSGVVVGLYAIIQNILYKNGGNHMEVMPGRPNATFAEPDWLGMFMVFMIALALAYLYYNAYHKHLWKFFDGVLFCITTIFFITLILTVARSAWIGVLAVIVVYALVLFLQKKYKLFAWHMLWMVSVGLVSIYLVFTFELTSFELGNRLQSTGSGLQEITVSCQSKESANELSALSHITYIDELAMFNCRHIDLEAVQTEISQNNHVIKIYRIDPNVAVRGGVYKKMIIAIKERPLTGYGWGGSGVILGSDERGTSLNASNIFLETMLSIGVIGVGVLIAIFVISIIGALRVLKNTTSMVAKSIAIFAILGTVAIIVPNLFNAGLLLGFVWIFFGLVDVVRKM